MTRIITLCGCLLLTGCAGGMGFSCYDHSLVDGRCLNFAEAHGWDKPANAVPDVLEILTYFLSAFGAVAE